MFGLMMSITFVFFSVELGPAANLASIFNNASNESTFQQLSQKRFFDPASLDLGAMAANPSISELLGCQRRERFVFRSCQIEILERYFQESSYPTTDVRAEIAAACNAALEKSGGFAFSNIMLCSFVGIFCRFIMNR